LADSIEELSASQLHYEVESRIVYCREHAVPQDRERFFMVGANCATAREGLVAVAFKLPRFEDEVPLEAALRGLEKPGEFVFGNSLDSCKTDHRVKAFTLVDPAMPPSYVRFVEWIRQPAPATNERPPTTDAHVVRKARPDDQALIEKFAPGQRWMDYKLDRAKTLKDLREALKATLEVARKPQVEGLSSPDFLEGLLERVNGGLLLRLMMEELDTTSVYEGEHHLLSPAYLGKGDDNHGDWFERLRAGRPCKTIVAHIGKDTYGYIHPFEHRPLSIREAARIQTFPDFFEFGTVGVVDGYGMIGNAVPPLISSLFAGRLAELHTQYGLFAKSPDSGVANKGHSPRRRKATVQRTLFSAYEEEAKPA
jgi:site-specific DNA-cytosine methylase